MSFKVSMFARNSGTEPVKELLDKSLQENQSQQKGNPSKHTTLNQNFATFSKRL